MSFEPITKPGDLPAINRERVKARGTDEVVDYLLRLVRALEERVLGKLVETVNLILQLIGPGVYYFSQPDVNGDYPEDSWRIIKLGDNIELQKKVSGTWTKMALWAE